MEQREQELLAYLASHGGRAHGLVETGQAFGPDWRETISRAEADGLVRVEWCTHGDVFSFDVVRS